jgi:hypothetical protein
MPAMRRGPNAYDLPLEDQGIPIDELGGVLPSRAPPPEVLAMAQAAPRDELADAQRESNLLRFLSTQGRGFDEAGRIIAGIPGRMEIDLAGADKPVQHVQQRQAEQYKVAQADAKKKAAEEAVKEKARLEKKKGAERSEDQKRADSREQRGYQNAMRVARLASGDKAAAAEFQKGNEMFDREQGLRKEFDSLPEVKNYRNASATFEALKSAFQSDPSGASDLTMIFTFMKTLDPGVSVQEGDVANAQNTGGLSDRIWGYYNQAVGNGRLSDEQRAHFVQEAEKQLANHRRRYDEVRRRYDEIATASGVEPGLVARGEATSRPAGDTVTIRVLGADGKQMGGEQTLPRANLGKAQARAASNGYTIEEVR